MAARMLKTIFPNQNYKTKVVKKKKGRRQKAAEGTRRFYVTQRLRTKVTNSLQEGLDLRLAVKKPDDTVIEEWLAASSIEAFNNAVVVWENFLAESCQCREMTAGPEIIYRWAESSRQKAVSLPASEYIEKLLDWVATQFSDETIFPAETDEAPVFGKKFEATIKNILRKLVRVYAHAFCHHWERVKELNTTTELLLSFKHYYFFVKEFDLVGASEMEPLKSLIDRIDANEA